MNRGYVLAEALVGGVVMMLAVASVLSALGHASAQIGRAMKDQLAAQVALSELERLRTRSVSSAEWKTDGTVACPSVVPAKWDCLITVQTVADNQVGGPVSVLHYKRARVEVKYPVEGMSAKDSLVMETLKW